MMNKRGARLKPKGQRGKHRVKKQEAKEGATKCFEGVSRVLCYGAFKRWHVAVRFCPLLYKLNDRSGTVEETELRGLFLAGHPQDQF